MSPQDLENIKFLIIVAGFIFNILAGLATAAVLIYKGGGFVSKIMVTLENLVEKVDSHIKEDRIQFDEFDTRINTVESNYVKHRAKTAGTT